MCIIPFQAVIGEPVQLLIPVKNEFQTTLVLKKIHLLWKFSSDDQADPIDNKSENAESFIQTNVVDSITVEKNSGINIMLGFTVKQPGELYITGESSCLFQSRI